MTMQLQSVLLTAVGEWVISEREWERALGEEGPVEERAARVAADAWRYRVHAAVAKVPKVVVEVPDWWGERS